MGFPVGQFRPGQEAIGNDVDGATREIPAPVHHVVTTVSLTTLTPPIGINRGFISPVYLIADSVFDWTTSGNIAAAPGTTLLANHDYGFIYDNDEASWYPSGNTP